MGKPGGQYSPRVAELTENEAKALELRKRGLTFQLIAQALNVPRSTAYSWVVQALEKADEALAENAKAHRELEAQRLDRLLMQHWPDATGKSDARFTATDKVLKIMDQRAKLLGLYTAAPESRALEDLKRERLEAEIRLIRARAAALPHDPDDVLAKATTEELEAILAAERARLGP